MSEVILLDTHVVLWLALEPERISAKAHAAIATFRKRNSGIAVSCISLYEIASASHRRRINLRISTQDFLAECESRFIVKPITSRICAETMRLPEQFPRDPMDRIIAATAIVEGAPLVTADVAIQESNAVRTLW